jgi:ribose transport system substrate-binding protein
MTRTNRVLVTLLLALLAAASLAAAPSREVTPTAELVAGMMDTSKYKADPPFTIGVSTMGEVNDWQVAGLHHINYGLKTKYKDVVGQVLYGHAPWDANKQINAIEDMVLKGIDLLILLPASEAALVSTIEKVMDKGIPVVLFGAKAFTDDFVSYVDRNNFDIGYTWADWLGEKLGGKGNVALVLGAPGNSYTEDVLRGAKSCFQAKYPDIKLVGPAYGFWSPPEAKKAMETLIRSTDRIDGVLVDGGLMGFAVIEAFKDANLPVPPLTADDWNGFLKIAKKENLDFCLVNSGIDLSLDAVDIAIKILKGEPVPHTVLAETQVYTSKDIDRLVKLNLPDSYWAINKLPESEISRLYK